MENLTGDIILRDKASKTIETVEKRAESMNRTFARSRQELGRYSESLDQVGSRRLRALTEGLESVDRAVPESFKNLVPGLDEALDGGQLLANVMPLVGRSTMVTIGVLGGVAVAAAGAVAGVRAVWSAMEEGERRGKVFADIESEFGDAQTAIDDFQDRIGNTLSEETVIPILVKFSQDQIQSSVADIALLTEGVKRKAYDARASVEESMAQVAKAINEGNGAFLEQEGYIDSANKVFVEYAESIGKIVPQLTSAEKSQALMNAALEMAATAAATPLTPLQSLRQAEEELAASSKDMGSAFLEAIVTLLDPSATSAAAFWEKTLRTLSETIRAADEDLTRFTSERRFSNSLDDTGAEAFSALLEQRSSARREMMAEVQRIADESGVSIMDVDIESVSKINTVIATAKAQYEHLDQTIKDVMQTVESGADIMAQPAIRAIQVLERLDQVNRQIDLKSEQEDYLSASVIPGVNADYVVSQKEKLLTEKSQLEREWAKLKKELESPVVIGRNLSVELGDVETQLQQVEVRMALLKTQIADTGSSSQEFEQLQTQLQTLSKRRDEMMSDPSSIFISPEIAFSIEKLKEELIATKERYDELMKAAENQPAVREMAMWQDEVANVETSIKSLAQTLDQQQMFAYSNAIQVVENQMTTLKEKIDTLSSSDTDLNTEQLRQQYAALAETQRGLLTRKAEIESQLATVTTAPTATPDTSGVETLTTAYDAVTAAIQQVTSAEENLQQVAASGDAVLTAQAGKATEIAQARLAAAEAAFTVAQAETAMQAAQQSGSEQEVLSAQAALALAESRLQSAQAAIQALTANQTLVEAQREVAAAEQEVAVATQNGAQIDVLAANARLFLSQVVLGAVGALQSSTSITTQNTDATRENSAAIQEQATVAGMAVDAVSGLPLAFQSSALSADQMSSAVADLAVQLHELEFAASNAAFSIAGRLVGALGVAGSLRTATAWSQQARTLREEFQNINEQRATVGQDPLSGQVLQFGLNELQKNWGAQASDMEAAMRPVAGGATKTADAWDQATKRIDSALNGMIEGLLKPTTDGLIDVDSMLPREDALDEKARRMADVAVKGFQSPWYEGLKDLFPEDILAQGEGAVKDAATRMVRDHSRGLTNMFYDTEAAAEKVIEQLQAKQSRMNLVDDIREQVKGMLPNVDDLDIMEALGINVEPERAAASARQSAQAMTLSFDEIISQFREIGEGEDNPFADILLLDDVDREAITGSADETVKGVGEAMVTQIEQGGYGTRMITALNTQIAAKKTDVEQGAKAAAQWWGDKWYGELKDSIPSGLLRILVAELLPLLEAAQKKEGERTSGGDR